MGKRLEHGTQPPSMQPVPAAQAPPQLPQWLLLESRSAQTPAQ
jgi:hypothetical protein